MKKEEATMKNLLKVLSVIMLLGLFMSPGVLGQTPVELTFWAPFTGPDGPYMERMVNQFNSEYEGKINVELRIIPEGPDFLTNLALAIRSGSPPAVAILSPTNYIRFMDNLTAYTSDDLLAKYGLDIADFNPNIMEAVIKDGKVYAIPLGTYCLGFYYNVDHFEAAGLEVRPPQNREEFLEYAAKLTIDKTGDGNIDQWAWFSFGGWQFRVLWQWYSVLWQNGGSVLTGDGSKAAFNSPAGIDALQLWVDMIHKEGAAPKEPADPEDAFRVGKLSMHVNGPWMINLFKEQADLNFRVAPMPVLGDDKGVWGDAHLMCIPKQSSAKTDATFTFVKWLSDNSLEWAKAGQVPVRTSIVQSNEFAELVEQSEYAKQLSYVNFLPQSEKLAEIESVLLEYMDAAYLGRLTPAEALAEAETEVNSILRRR